MGMTVQPIRAALFDLDDTLYNRSAAFAGRAEGCLRETCGLADPAAREQALARIASLDAGGYGSKRSVLEEVCRLYPCAGEGQSAAEASALFYKQFFAGLALDAEAAQTPAALDAAQIPWGVVTNRRARQWRK